MAGIGVWQPGSWPSSCLPRWRPPPWLPQWEPDEQPCGSTGKLPIPRPTHDALEPGLEHLLRLRGRWRHDVWRIRQEVLLEITELVEDTQLPGWAKGYCTPDRNAPTQVPLMLYLLDQLGYPHMEGMTADLTDSTCWGA